MRDGVARHTRRLAIPLIALAVGASWSLEGANAVSDVPAEDVSRPILGEAPPATPPSAAPSQAPISQAPPEPKSPVDLFTAVGDVADSAFQATGDAVSAVVDLVWSAAWGVRQALFETAFMAGATSSLFQHGPPGDADPDVAPPAETVPATDTARRIASAAEPPKTPAPASAAPAASTALSPLDPGLLDNLLFDRGSRNPDGSYFVPKNLQRVFGVRTRRVQFADVPATVTLAASIVPDPQAHGHVEAGVIGRIEPADDGLPVLGDEVAKGQVLGYVVPVIGVVDRGQVRREVARLTSEIRVTTETLSMLRQFSFVPFREGKIVHSEMKLDGLRRERAALLPMLQTKEILRAPTQGVISTANAVNGKVVQPGEVVFDIVNPKMLWVEATATDPSIVAAVPRGAAATARTPEGRILNLSYVGSGLSVRQQAAPMLFRIDTPPQGLRVGRPVTVFLKIEAITHRGLAISRDAVTTGVDNVQQVWEQTEPETFVPRPVRNQSVDAETVLIVGGLNEGAHVVVRGAGLMTQLQ